jgi:hypothetical protein
MPTEWTPEMAGILRLLYYKYGPRWTTIAEEMGLSAEKVRSYWRLNINNTGNRLEISPYPRYDKPLTMEGDAVIIPDLELPFHKAEFVNRLLDLCQAWGIDQCIMAGDFLHFDSLSGWEANWQYPNGHGGLDEKQEEKLVNFLTKLGTKQQAQGFALLEEIGMRQEDGDPNLSEELRTVRKAAHALSQCFKIIQMDLGNHEGRMLRTLKTPLFPSEITRMIDAKEWCIAPFYYSYLESGGESFVIEHPKSASVMTAERLASKYQKHTVVAHSHILRFSWDVSGQFYAITSGCCVDEALLPYAAQRHTNAPAHLSGATIVRDGVPYLIHEKIDWTRYAKM